MATKTKDMNPIANAYEGGDVVRLTKGISAKPRGGGEPWPVRKGAIGTVMFQARKDSALVAFKGAYPTSVPVSNLELAMGHDPSLTKSQKSKAVAELRGEKPKAKAAPKAEKSKPDKYGYVDDEEVGLTVQTIREEILEKC